MKYSLSIDRQTHAQVASVRMVVLAAAMNQDFYFLSLYLFVANSMSTNTKAHMDEPETGQDRRRVPKKDAFNHLGGQYQSNNRIKCPHFISSVNLSLSSLPRPLTTPNHSTHLLLLLFNSHRLTHLPGLPRKDTINYLINPKARSQSI